MTALAQALLYAHEYSSALSGNTFASGGLSHQYSCGSRSAHKEAAEVRMSFQLKGRFSCQRRLPWFWGWEGYNNSIYCSLAQSGSAPSPRHAPRHAPLREDGLGNFGKQLISGNNRLVFVPQGVGGVSKGSIYSRLCPRGGLSHG